MNGLTGKHLIETARTYLGTPTVHQGRLKGAGVDCIGLVVCAAKEAGVPVRDRQENRTYVRVASGHYSRGMLKHLDALCTQVNHLDSSKWQLGDVIVFRRSMANEAAQHMGLLSKTKPFYLLHACSHVHRVVEHTMSKFMIERILRVYRLPGIIEESV